MDIGWGWGHGRVEVPGCDREGGLRPIRRLSGAWAPALTGLLVAGCSAAGGDPVAPEPGPGVIRLPLVVHVVHLGEPVGVGHNLSVERIQGQIRLLNDDFRRRAGTRGHNTHPAGADAGIEFELARMAPDGSHTSGIVRIDSSTTPNPVPPGALFDHYAAYSYWDPEHYINVWTLPLPAESIDVVLGMATGPETDLPGSGLLLPGEPLQAEGILVNSWHFGESTLDSGHALGRTLTHEMGHYLGLLHPWAGGSCESDDFCADTPPVGAPVTGCPSPPPPGCDGRPVQVGNYMNYTSDRCMNLFTRDQVLRMHHVLERSPRRRGLATSPGLG